MAAKTAPTPDSADATTAPAETPAPAPVSGGPLDDLLDPASRAALESFRALSDGDGEDGATAAAGAEDTPTPTPAPAEPEDDGDTAAAPEATGPGDEVGDLPATAGEDEEDDGDGTDGQSDDDGPEAEADGDDEDDAEPEDRTPKWAQKRIDKLVAQRNEAREELEAASARAEQAQRELEAAQAAPVALQPTPKNPLSDIRTTAELEGRLAQAQNTLEWCLGNLDGGTAPTENGGEREYSAEEVARYKAAAEAVLYRHGPARARYLETYGQAVGVARDAYPDLFKQGTEASRQALAMLQEVPALLDFPDHVVMIGDLLTGMQVRMGKKKLMEPASKAAAPATGEAAPAAAAAPAKKPRGTTAPPQAAPAARRPAARTTPDDPGEAARRAAAHRLYAEGTNDAVEASIAAKIGGRSAA